MLHPSDVAESRGDIKFYVSKSTFRLKDSVSYAEIAYMLDLSSFIEDTVESLTYRVSLELTDPSGKKKPLSDEFEQTLRNPSSTGFIIDQFTLFLMPGDYDLKLSVQSGKRKGEVLTRLQVPDYSGDTLQISEIQFAWHIGTDTTSRFAKYGIEVVPNPTSSYYPGHDTLLFFYEIYNLVPDTGKYLVLSAIYDSDSNVVRATRPKVKDKSEGLDKAVEIGGIALQGLNEGIYTLKIQVMDMSNQNSATASRKFVYSLGQVEMLSTELLDYAGFIEYFATADELEQYEQLDETGKLVFLRRFWPAHGLTIQQVIERVRYADEHFTVGKTLGRYTDRGRIYIKYGPPDEITRGTFELESRDREIWHYYRASGIEFIFVDISGTGDYRLVYSSIPDEPTMPDWQRYVSPEEVQGGEW